MSPKSEFEVCKLGVPSHEITQKENHLVKKYLKHILLTKQPPYLLLCKGTLTCTSSITPEVKALPPLVEKLLKEFGDVFPSEGPTGLPPFRGIKHQIDFVLGASLPNRPEYKINPEETKEIESQVQELMRKGWVQKSLSPCVVPILVVPKKDGKWHMCCDCRAVNNITIKYRHPILRLNDMLHVMKEGPDKVQPQEPRLDT